MQKGLRGSEIRSLPQTEEELMEHIELAHHIVVKREGETELQAEDRFLKAHPEAATCEDCVRHGAPWTKRGVASE